jgi:glycosyltransferase involved in cell wall biosynthesis
MHLRSQGSEMPTGRSVGIVGLLTPWKGHQVGIDAFVKVVTAYSDATLWIVGTGHSQEYTKRLKGQVKDLGLNGKVMFTGYVTDAGPFIKNISVLVSASTEPDPFPRVILEGMALGVPIVASAIGGIPEQIEDGINGYLVEPENAEALANGICKLLDNLAQATVMGQAGMAMVREKFTLVQHVNQVESLYASLLA